MSFVSYHCHSTWSDGKASSADMVRAANDAGLSEFALSDHVVLTPFENSNAHLWSMPRNGKRVQDALAALRQAAEGSTTIIRYALETDFFPETCGEVAELVDGLDLDLVIGSVHYLDDFPIDYSPEAWQPLDQSQIDDAFRLYWIRIRQLAECGIFDVVGHLDLPKKFAMQPQADLCKETGEALDAIAEADMAIELNCAGWDKPCKDAYPTESLLRQARERGIPVLLSADAHAPDEVARHYDDGAERLRRAGYDSMLRFEKRRRIDIPIPG